MGQVPLPFGSLTKILCLAEPTGPSVAVHPGADPRDEPRRRPGAPDPHGPMAGRASIPLLRARRRRLLGQGSGAEGAAPVLTVKPPAGPCNAPIPWHRDSAPTPGGLGEATAGIPASVLRAVHGAAAPRAARAHGTAVAPPAVGATLLQFVPAWGRDNGGGRWRAEGFAWGANCWEGDGAQGLGPSMAPPKGWVPSAAPVGWGHPAPRAMP